MSPHTSSLAVALARIETIVEVRPEEEGPKISLIAPRGSPPVRMSRESIPVGTFSKTRRSGSVKGDGIRSPKADSNRARRITDCIEVHRDDLFIPNICTVCQREAMSKRQQQTAAPLIPPNPTIPNLRATAANCRACDLWKTGTQTVFGEGGGTKPRVMLVGEQPGDQEDIQGHPFVG